MKNKKFIVIMLLLIVVIQPFFVLIVPTEQILPGLFTGLVLQLLVIFVILVTHKGFFTTLDKLDEEREKAQKELSVLFDLQKKLAHRAFEKHIMTKEEYDKLVKKTIDEL